MTIAVAIASVVGCFIVAALVVDRIRAALTRQVDETTAQIRAESLLPSRGPTDALKRLERAALAGREDAAAEQSAADRFSAALAAVTLGIVILDHHGRTIHQNPFARSFLTGRHGDALVGQVIHDLAEAALSGRPAEQRVQLYGPPPRNLHVTARPIEDGGAVIGAVVVIDDVTEHERLDSLRRDFVSNISHELRTPIGAVSLLAETLVDETDPEVVATLARRMAVEAERLGQTVEDLLQLSRIEHGATDGFGPVALQSVVRGAIERVSAAAEQNRVDIGVTLPERELCVHGDAVQLTSAVFNLLDNGVKYIGNDGGVISVRARRAADQIDLVVQDSGIGVPRKDLDRIFERFYRVDQGRSRASGGAGLGLAIVRHIVANHGGSIITESTEGEGSTFTVHLPALDPPDRSSLEIGSNEEMTAP